jgi:phospholipid-binding lipoprotein MlaA
VDLHFGGADPSRSRRHAIAASLIGTMLLAAAPALAQETRPGAQIPDPWERVNRAMFRWSMAVDRALIEPGIRFYVRVTPQPVRTGVRNVVYNLDEPKVFANDVLQLRFRKAGETTIRFVANSTVGLGGLIDVAGQTGLPGHNSDFGQTLGRWGVGTGPYIFVPFAGSTDLRDGIGRLADAFGDPVSWTLGDLKTTFGQTRAGLRVFEARVDLEDQIEGLNRDFTDPYATLRSGFSQNRAFKVQEAKGVSAAEQVNDLPDFSGETPSAAKP